MRVGPEILVLVAAAVVIPLVWLIAVYNRFVRLRQHMRESWADISVELKRRHDLIPALVETVKGYAAHEKAVLERVVELRNVADAKHTDAAALGRDETQLMREVKRRFAVVEAYPQLKADRNFMQLQEELALTEDRIAAARRFFNANVRDFNRMCESFPTNIVGGMFSFKPESFFTLESDAERVVPRIDLSLTQPGLA